MELIFTASGITQRGRGLTFDDVLLVPQHSEIPSRSIPNLKARITTQHTTKIPLISANMDTVTGRAMAQEMGRIGGLGILHRFMNPETQVADLRAIKAYFGKAGLSAPVAASTGVKEEGKKRADMLADEGIDILTIDIAHGDSVMMLGVLEYAKRRHPHIAVIAGNVASSEGAQRMIDCGADAIKVGIGPGSMCTTRIITGHGVPQLTAIALCAAVARKYKVPVIADGGLRNSGDMVKALCAGADSLMVGSLLSGTEETPGSISNGKKQYHGMASKTAQTSWRGELPSHMAAEGVETTVPLKGPVESVINGLMGGIRSGMTYLGVNSIADMAQAARFMEISYAGMNESVPHGVQE